MEPKAGEQLCPGERAHVSAAERECTIHSRRRWKYFVLLDFVFTFSGSLALFLSLCCGLLNGEVFSCSWTQVEFSSWTTAGRVGSQSRNAARNVSRLVVAVVVNRESCVSRVLLEAADDACFWRRYFVCWSPPERNKNKAQKQKANRRQSEI